VASSVIGYNSFRRLRRWVEPLSRLRIVGLLSELAYWYVWTYSPKTAAERGHLLDPELPFPDSLDDVVSRIPREHVRMLEVGAGPITTIGRRHPTKEIELVATDVLADHYRRMLALRGIKPQVPTIRADAEHLSASFANDTFDLIYAGNCLDHMARPMIAVEEMLKVTRPGGWIVLHHIEDEGMRQGYLGLHQWNVSGRDGHLVLWTPEETIDLTERLASRCEVRVSRTSEHVRAEIHKL
jgi:SAM-dependent methyltransferase